MDTQLGNACKLLYVHAAGLPFPFHTPTLITHSSSLITITSSPESRTRLEALLGWGDGGLVRQLAGLDVAPFVSMIHVSHNGNPSFSASR